MKLQENRWHWHQYAAVYAASLLLCWASLALALHLGGNYLSVLSWNLFGVEELCRYLVAQISARELARSATGPASLAAAAITAPVFALTAALIRSPKLRISGIVIAVVLGIGTLVWFPNPWGY
jgi:hypothetical protein